MISFFIRNAHLFTLFLFPDISPVSERYVIERENYLFMRPQHQTGSVDGVALLGLLGFPLLQQPPPDTAETGKPE